MSVGLPSHDRQIHQAMLTGLLHAAVRIRPPPTTNDTTNASVPPRFRASRAHAIDQSTLAIDTASGRKQFAFDRVFPETETQEGIWTYISEAVDAFVQGYNVSIMAYGQSGAGKSYTMGTVNPEERANAGANGMRRAQQGIGPCMLIAYRDNTASCCRPIQDIANCDDARRTIWIRIIITATNPFFTEPKR